MSILDNLLGDITGGSSGTSETFVGNTTELATSPAIGVAASDVNLHNESVLGTTDLGIGEVGLGVSAPLDVFAATQVSHEGDGGLLSGLL
jgi:hypothetical protein